MQNNNRYIPDYHKKIILDRQNFKCANYPGSNLFRIGNPICPLWESKRLKGRFNEAGFQIDHVIEFSLTSDNNLNNLQALCPSCHTIKTKNFQNNLASERNSFIVDDLNNHAVKFCLVKNVKIAKSNNKKKIISKLLQINESKYNIPDLRKRQKSNQLNETEKLVLKKYFFRRTFNISHNCSKSDMERYLNLYLNKEILLHRFNVLFGYKNLDDYQVDSFSDGKEKSRISIITDFINRLTGKKYKRLNDELTFQFNNSDFKKGIRDIAFNSIYFHNEEANRALFFKKKCTLRKYSDSNHLFYANSVRALLKSYNILLTPKRVRNGKLLEYNYSLSVDQRIKDIVLSKFR